MSDLLVSIKISHYFIQEYPWVPGWVGSWLNDKVSNNKNTYTTIRNEWMKYKLIKRKHLKNLKTYETLQEDGWKHPTTNQLNKRPNKLNTYQLNKDRYIKHSKNFLLLSAKLEAKAINNITEQRLVSVFYQTIIILCEN